MSGIKRILEWQIRERAEEIAQNKYGHELDQMDEDSQFAVWQEAENDLDY